MALFAKTTTTRLDIEGMTCDNCVRHVTEALEAVSGVKTAKVTRDPGQAEVEATDKATVDAMTAAVEKAGYTAKACH